MLTEVATGALVHQSELLRNNTVVVEGRSGVLLVDPGITWAEMSCLAGDVGALDRTVVAGFATHPDWDHVLWHDAFGDVPRYGTRRCAALLRSFRAQVDWRDHAAAGLPPEIAEDTPLELYGLVEGLPDGVADFPWEGPRIRVVEHPAHSPGHAALVVEDSGVLIAGDMLSDVFIPMLDEFGADNDPVAEYLVGLDVLEEAARDVDVVVPGHGSVARGHEVGARIEQDRAYLHALRDGRRPDDPRLGDSAEPGWEWVGDIHEGQARSVTREARRRRHADLP